MEPFKSWRGTFPELPLPVSLSGERAKSHAFAGQWIVRAKLKQEKRQAQAKEAHPHCAQGADGAGPPQVAAQVFSLLLLPANLKSFKLQSQRLWQIYS